MLSSYRSLWLSPVYLPHAFFSFDLKYFISNKHRRHVLGTLACRFLLIIEYLKRWPPSISNHVNEIQRLTKPFTWFNSPSRHSNSRNLWSARVEQSYLGDRVKLVIKKRRSLDSVPVQFSTGQMGKRLFTNICIASNHYPVPLITPRKCLYTSFLSRRI